MSLLIKGGLVVTGGEQYVADVLVEGERISAIGSSLRASAERVIDAAGAYVLPGAVDPHTHLEMPFGGTTTCDDFTSGTVAAAHGGTTSIVDFCIQAEGQPIGDALATWHEKVARCPPVIDVGFHLAVTDLSVPGALADLRALPAQGVTSIKLFMAYKDSIMVDDASLFRTMQVAAETGALVLVHAENGDAIDVLIEDALARGRTQPIWHARTRPPATEAEATARAIQLAHVAGCRLYVVHVSCREALEPVRRARDEGWPVWAETCTQYLFIDEAMLDAPDFEGAKYVFTPPPRTQADRDALWTALARGDLDAVTSDHCPFDWDGQKSLGREDFSKIPNGAPGIEHRLLMLHHHGVRSGRLTLPRLVDLVATQPARLFDLHPRKGAIAIGADADIVVFDPQRRVRLSAAAQHSNVDYSLYEDEQVVGAPAVVVSRGRVIVEDGQLVAEPGHGRFLHRPLRMDAGTAA